MSNATQPEQTSENKKTLYDYQQKDLQEIFNVIETTPTNFNLLYQLPTGGGKTVVFCEIVRRYIETYNRKVVILTHRVELSKQTSKMLSGFGVQNKIINSTVKEIPDQDQYQCFTAMVETLNNRLNDQKLNLEDIGLVIIDEAHYNSFRKLFKFFENCFILGVTATPLSSNIKLPIKDTYKKLIVGNKITTLIQNGYLAKAEQHHYDVALGSLKIGASGDYTVKSSESLYTHLHMLDKLLYAYEELSKGKKTLIFNNGIQTSKEVYHYFLRAGYPIKHLDNTNTKQERKEILKWFKQTPNGILTSVSILTTGFDEPTVESIILNRATRSLTLYFQMIGRGSRVLDDKKHFKVIDLGNNMARFGPWDQDVDWTYIFKNPDEFLDQLRLDEDIEHDFVYEIPDSTRKRFKGTKDVSFDIQAAYEFALMNGHKSITAIEKAIEQHSQMIIENSETIFEARALVPLLEDDIIYRIKLYSRCIMNSTQNYKDYLKEEYIRKLRLSFNGKF